MSIPHAILAELTRGPLHGYALRSRLQRRLGFLWPVNHGQVYATLGRLGEGGALSATEREPRPGSPDEGPGRTWEITAAGERLLAEWCARQVAPAPAGGEIREKIASAIAQGDPAVVDAFLARQVASCSTLLDACRHESRGRAASDDPARRLLDRAALRLLEADLAWLEAVRSACAGLRD
ncbi:MAG: PadR family transcriptional regulator [Alphaproteobacteria bacterium]